MTKYLKRIGDSNGRSTKSKVYQYNQGKIIDDVGNTMSPYLDNNKYWIPASQYEYNAQSAEYQHEFITEPKEPTMLKIETVTLINGQRLTDFKADTLINYIQKEEANIKALEQVSAVSKAINHLKKRHQTNIKALVTILDDIDTDDDE